MDEVVAGAERAADEVDVDEVGVDDKKVNLSDMFRDLTSHYFHKPRMLRLVHGFSRCRERTSIPN